MLKKEKKKVLVYLSLSEMIFNSSLENCWTELWKTTVLCSRKGNQAISTIIVYIKEDCELELSSVIKPVAKSSYQFKTTRHLEN